MTRGGSAVSALLAFCAVLLAGFAARAQPLIAEVRLNGQASGVAQFERRGGDLVLKAGQLPALRLASPAGASFSSDVVLGDLPGVDYRIDEATQSVDITAQVSAISPSRLAMGRPIIQMPDTPSWGVSLNYALFGQKTGDGPAEASAIGELRVFGPRGVLTQSFSARRAGGAPNNGVRRLETTYVYEDFRHGRRLMVGDFISAGNPWSPSVRAGGVRLTTDVSLRPDVITQPLPQIKGAAATPSSVDLYIDGVRRLQSKAAPGPFSIDAAPMVDGRGRVDLVITDALGRQTVRSLPFYAASELMAPGRTDYSLEAGVLRVDFASDTDRYTDAFAALSIRRGLTGFMTVEGRVAGRRDRQTAGLGVTAKLFEEALFTIAFNQSGGGGASGGQVYASARRETQRYALFATLQRRGGAYRDFDEIPGTLRVRQSLQLGASLRDYRWGAWSASYSWLERADGGIGFTGLSWSKGFGRLSLYANAFSGDRGQRRVNLGLSLPLGGRSSSVSATSSSEGARFSAAVASTPPQPYGWDWRLAADAGSGGAHASRLEAEIRRASGLGELGVAVSAYGGHGAVQAYASGALLWMGGMPVATARLGDGFAIIDTGAPGIEVTVENRPAGRTGRNGRLLAPQLSPQAASHIALRAESVGLAQDILVQTVSVRPPRGAGLVVRMPVVWSRAVMAQFVEPDGRPVGVGLAVSVDGQDSGLTGFDGMAYLSRLTDRNIIEIKGQSGVCRAEVHHDPKRNTKGPEAPIGPLVCRPVAPDQPDPGRIADSSLGAGLHR